MLPGPGPGPYGSYHHVQWQANVSIASIHLKIAFPVFWNNWVCPTQLNQNPSKNTLDENYAKCKTVQNYLYA